MPVINTMRRILLSKPNKCYIHVASMKNASSSYKKDMCFRSSSFMHQKQLNNNNNNNNHQKNNKNNNIFMYSTMRNISFHKRNKQDHDDDQVIYTRGVYYRSISSYYYNNTNIPIHNPTTTTLMLKKQYHTTVPKENVLVYAIGGAVAVLAGGILLDGIQKVIDARGKQSDVPHSSGGRNFYKGAFEPTMTKREAALILGVRESASKERVKEAHRKVLMLNHPDTGGSTYVATKINEAKDMLLGEQGTGRGGE